ncbi:PREDICTED: uncharacterized protein LOC108614440 [Drosophila arizonae]|uniref:Uncharacterized protein LOC108614440 n=1 Tax=Drosophila arizonae TaxID=7263 RepID=A0ABM1PA20_DROAR|nr:PREDICTED: uncharacterized protein LOC108614440 [Drosophila arizonae]
MSISTRITLRALVPCLLAALALQTSLSHGHGHHGGGGKNHAAALTELANGASLVLKSYSGNVMVRAAREAEPDKLIPAATTPTTGGNKRVKNNRKSNKSNNQMQRADAVGARKPGSKKSSASTGKEQLQLQRHMIKPQGEDHQQQQQQHQHKHRASKRSGAKAKASEKGNGQSCRYVSSSWTDCDAKTNMRTRTMTLRKGESSCLPTRTVQKKCRKACRYEKGAWSECKAGQMTREDKVKVSEDGSHQSCNQVRTISKKCDSGTAAKNTANGARSSKVRKHKEKGARHTPPQA